MVNDFRTLSQNEQIAREISGIEGNATFFNADTRTLDEMVEQRNREKWNDSVQEVNDKFEKHVSAMQEAAENFAKDTAHVEIKPIGNYVIVHPYSENPFQKVKVTASGIIYDLGGMTPEYKSSDTGEMEEAEQYIHTGAVVEVGPECKWLQIGDAIMWTKPSEVPIPFYDFGLVLVNEARALCVINDNLTERFNHE